MKKEILLHSCLRGLLCIAAWSIVTSSAGAQQQDVTQLLQKMHDARRSVSYTGEVAIERSFRGRSFEFNKRVISRPPRVYREELILTPEQEERLRDRRDRRDRQQRRRDDNHWNDRFQFERRMESPVAARPVQMELLRQNYDITVNPDEPIAGRDVVLLSVSPKYPLRPVNKLWIDRETGVILKWELSEREQIDVLIYRETFTSINYEEAGPETARESREPRERNPERQDRRGRMSSSSYNSIEEMPENVRDDIVVPEVIPEGFALDNVRIYRERGRVSFHQVYTDGLLLFSLFQTGGDLRDQIQRFRSRDMNRGPLEMNMLIKSTDKLNFILLGQTRRALLKQVLDSLPGVERDVDT
ncbi:sigma-E factor regulatory protein RseB domain-containing protein [candidate division KSB1 bacterium]